MLLSYTCFLNRAKHPTKVHVWAGISKHGRTGICLFESNMDAPLYIEVLEQTLLPFIELVYPDGHRFMADTDPKHTSKRATDFLDEKGVNWWRTPAESPDCNPIKNLWHELKEFNRRVVKPTTKEQLIGGIKEFWETVTVTKHNKYINHLKKVLPKVIELSGATTGY